MTIVTNTTDRKALAKAIGEDLGIPAKYMGVPRCGYQIGEYVLEKDGTLTGANFEALWPFLQRNGMVPEDAEPMVPENEIPEAAQQAEPEVEASADDTLDFVSVSVPADNLTTTQLKNLIFMLYTKQYLIGRMTGGDTLNIPDILIARLMEDTPESMTDFLALLDSARENGMTGFDFKDDKVTLTYRTHPDELERNMVYAMLTARILKAAREATRVFPERQEPENEKYFARAWLLRIGYGGANCKDERNLLLKHLKGYSAFPNSDAAERHKEKYAAIRQERKQEVTADE